MIFRYREQINLSFVCDNQRDLRETHGFLLYRLIEYSYVNILSQIAQRTQMRMQQAALYRRERQFDVVVRLMWFCGLVCVNLRDLRETLGFSLCGLFEYSCVFILPQIAQITQTNTAKLYYFAEKDRLFEVKAVLLFVCVNLRDQRETCWGFLCVDRLSTLA